MAVVSLVGSPDYLYMKVCDHTAVRLTSRAEYFQQPAPRLARLVGPGTVENYKKCQAGDTAEQHRALTTVSTIMRLSVLALFIALPAAAYAAVLSREKHECTTGGNFCHSHLDCCSKKCELIRVDYGKVRLMAHLL